MSNNIKVLCLGDVVGRPGREAVCRQVPLLRQERALDLVIVNAENCAGGLGVDVACAEQLYGAGVDVITLGDHTWKYKEINEFLNSNKQRCIRPGNYPSGAAGQGFAIWTTPSGVKIGIMNLIGRVFMSAQLDCPFKAVDEYLKGPLSDCPIRILDFHAEASSEKVAMGRYLDTKASFVFGTHNHVQTADDQILSGGTAYITDLGMCGPKDSVIGMDEKVAFNRFLTGRPFAYQVAGGAAIVQGAVVEIDSGSSKAVAIERVRIL